MRKFSFITLLLALCCVSASAEYKMYLMGDTSFCSPADGFTISMDTDNLKISGNGTDASFAKSKVSGLKFLKPLVIDFSDLDNLKDSNIPDGVAVDVDGGNVKVTFNNDFGVNYYDIFVTGSSSDGSLVIDQSSKLKLTLDNLSLSAKGKAAINIYGTKNIDVELVGENSIKCSENTSAQNAAIYSEASLNFMTEADGKLTVKSNVHGIRSREGVALTGTEIAINASNDGVRANDFFVMNSGTLDITAAGDGVDANKSYITINGGSLNYENLNTSVDVKALKCDGDITVNGGHISLNLNGTDNKGLSTGKYEVDKANADSAFGNIVINDGSISVFMNGIMKDGDTSSCSALKADGDILINGGEIYLKDTLKLKKSKGLNADGNVIITDADMIKIELYSDAGRCIASEKDVRITGGNFDLYSVAGLIDQGLLSESSASCIKADGGIYISGNPSLILESYAIKGKGLNADTIIEIKGGNIECLLHGVGAKGISCGYETGGSVVIDGAETVIDIQILGGGLYKYEGDDSKANGIKSDGTVDIKNGNVSITSDNEDESNTFEAIRGISAGGDVNISGGMTKIKLNDAEGKTYAIKSDGTITIKADCIEYSCPDSDVLENSWIKD